MHRDWSIAIQKLANVPVEAIAIQTVEEWYQAQGLRVYVRHNSALDLTGKQKFDLIDTFGKTWEVKADKRWHRTGNVFIEHLSHSDFDYLLIFAFFPYILTRQQYLDVIADPRYPVKQGGDNLAATGSLLTLAQLTNLSENHKT